MFTPQVRVAPIKNGNIGENKPIVLGQIQGLLKNETREMNGEGQNSQKKVTHTEGFPIKKKY